MHVNTTTTNYEQKHDKVILQHDNARPYVAVKMEDYMKALKWDVLPPSLILKTLLLPAIICFDQ